MFGEDGRKKVVSIDSGGVDCCVLVGYVLLHNQIALILLSLRKAVFLIPRVFENWCSNCVE